MTWMDQNFPTKGAFFVLIFWLEKCVTFCHIFINIFINYFGNNNAFITDYEELLLFLDKTVLQLSITLSTKMSSRSKINCGHCGQFNTVEYALDIHCPIIGQLYVRFKIIRQLNIHYPTIGQLDIRCPTIRQLNIHCPIIG